MNMTIVLNVLICTLLVVLGFLARLALESWRDYHVQKALHEARLEAAREADPQHRYRRVDRRKRKEPVRQLPVIPMNILRIMQDKLRRDKCCGATRLYGRWRGAA